MWLNRNRKSTAEEKLATNTGTAVGDSRLLAILKSCFFVLKMEMFESM
jgi:hypothetical protein